jgi:hypothetical protein
MHVLADLSAKRCKRFLFFWGVGGGGGVRLHNKNDYFWEIEQMI